MELKPVTAVAGSTSTMSCTISDVTDTLTVVWRDQNKNTIGDGNGYSVTQGEFVFVTLLPINLRIDNCTDTETSRMVTSRTYIICKKVLRFN